MIEKIAVKGHYVWVDKDAEIKEGELVCGGLGGNDIKKYGKYFANDWYKIVAASPELNLEGVPTYVRWLARKEFPKDGTQESGYLAGGYVIGYQAAEKELYTEDDVRKAIAIGFDWCHQKQLPTDYMIDEFIKQLKQGGNK